MDAALLETSLREGLADVRLLDHPFYQRWQAGELAAGELAAYAEQYRHFEAALPTFLGRILDRLPENSEARQYIRQNLADEVGETGRPHVVMFADFLYAVKGDGGSAPSPATIELLQAYDEAIAQGAIEGMSALVAYEMQAPEIAASKADGLRRYYDLDAAGCEFWDLHATMDEDHSAWAIAALAEAGADRETSVGIARRTAEAWWAFLDEREAARPVAA